MNLLFVILATITSVFSVALPTEPRTEQWSSTDPFDSSNSTLCWKRRVWVEAQEYELDYDSSYPSGSFHLSSCGGLFPAQCGLGCAVSEAECRNDIYKEITSVAEVAFNIGQIIIAATQSPDGNPHPNALVPLGAWAKNVAEGLIRSSMTHFLAKSLGEDGAQQLAQQIIKRAFGDVQQTIDWSIADPTGVSDVIKSFWKPLCPVV